MSEREPVEIFLNRVPIQLLIQITDPRTESYASQLSTKIDTTYAHTIKTINKLESLGLIGSYSKGRKKIVKETEEGKDLARIAQKFMDELEGIEKSEPISA